MPRTKHLYIAVVLFIGFLIGVTSALLFLRDGPVHSSAPVTFSDTQGEYSAAISTDESLAESREALIARVQEEYDPDAPREREDAAEQSESESERTAQETDREGGVALADNAISPSTRSGSLYLCDAPVGSGAGVDAEALPWVSDGEWFPDAKPVVEGTVFHESEVSFDTREGARVVISNSLPPHPTGKFPIDSRDDAYGYTNAPRTIRESEIRLELPRIPQKATAASCVPAGVVGVARNGVLIHSALNAAGEDMVARSPLDNCGGHPDEAGTYHYYTESECLTDAYYEGAVSTLIGYALDGYGIFSSNEAGREITNADLDACHGHTHPIPWDGEMRNMYHYHMTDEFPYSVGCFRGTPRTVRDASDLPAHIDTATGTSPSEAASVDTDAAATSTGTN